MTLTWFWADVRVRPSNQVEVLIGGSRIRKFQTQREPCLAVAGSCHDASIGTHPGAAVG
jgi:hypothetical protein